MNLEYGPSRLLNYSFASLCRLAKDTLLTRVFNRPARLIRRPATIRGSKWVVFGQGFTSGSRLRIDALAAGPRTEPLIRIGERVCVNDDVHIGAIEGICIGNDVLIASKVFISDHNHGSYGHLGLHTDPATPPMSRALSAAPIKIEDNVWIGEFVAVLPGTTIGYGSIIGAMSVVSRDIPPRSIAVGAPARVIKRFDEERKEWIAV